MYNFKKIAALGLAFTMVIGSSVTAFATDTEQTISAKSTADTAVVGTGSEEYIDKNIMKVTMPTTAAIAKFFDYKLDPQGLIAEAKNYAGTEITGTATGIVFKNEKSGKFSISNTSDVFTITNKSSIPVDMSVKVQLTGGDNDITASTTSDFSGSDATKAIYLGLKATNDVERALSTDEESYDATLLSGASQYKVTYASNAYTYAAIDNAKFKDFTFTVTGAINTSLSSDTWATITGDVGGTGRTPTKKTPPVINIKLQFNPVEDPFAATLKWSSVTENGAKVDVLTVAKKDAASGKGGFVSGDVAKVYVNGREITSSDYSLDDNGFINIKLEKLFPGYSSKSWSDAVAADKTAVKNLIKSVKTTADDKPTFYGEL